METTRTALHHKEITRTALHREGITTVAHHHKETSKRTARHKMEEATTHSRVTHKLDKMVEVMRGIILLSVQVTMDRLRLEGSKVR